MDLGKLIKFLKPFIFSLIIAVGLLYAQAMTDLALPDFMSNIVNTGIQQSGIEDSIPQVIRAEDLNKMKLFLSDEDEIKVDNSYELVSKDDASYEEIKKTYKDLEGESVYRLKELSKEEKNELNPVMSQGMLSYFGLKQMIQESGDDGVKFGEMTVPKGVDIFDMLAKMPEDKLAEIRDNSTGEFAKMGESGMKAAGANMVKENYISLGRDVESIQSGYILKTGGIMLLISLLGAVCSVIVGFIGARVAGGVGRDLRRKIFMKVSSFSNMEMDKFSTASLITRSTNDVTQIQTLLVIMIRMVVYAPIMGIGGVLKATSRNSSMSWILALAVGLLLALVIMVFFVAVPKFKLVQKLVDKVNLVTRENLSGMMVIRAFNNEKFEEKRFDKVNHEVRKTNLFVNRVMVFMMPAMMLVMNGTMLLIVWFGAKEIANAQMQVGDMMAFMQYAMQIIFAFIMMSMMFILIPRAAVSAQRISEVLETEPSIVDRKDAKESSEKCSGVLKFNNVSFKYPGAEENMLKNINFTAKPGETTAIIGSTGSGKTTLANLIPRFYDVSEGEITIDGLDIRDITQKDLRKNIGYVPQKASLFSGTIESNMKFGNKMASQKLLEDSADIAQATEFIQSKEKKFESEISQGGTNVSGGQKQRLSIARALVKEAQIYLFDDSFSALDFKTDSALRKALKEKTGGSTVIIVAQRISTIKRAEQIIVLDEGNIAGIGTHEELMNNCETYREIALSQLSEEELS